MTQKTSMNEEITHKSLVAIAEFSEMSGIKQSKLRYWDDIGLFRPAQRNLQNNYRYYSPDQLATANLLMLLSSLRIPLKAMKDISQNRSPENILWHMQQQESVLDIELERLRETCANIHTLCDAVRQGNSFAEPRDFSLKALNEMTRKIGLRQNPQAGRSYSQSI